LRVADDFFRQHRLWIAHYREKPTLPRGFYGYFLHQYTGDGSGPEPHEVPGIETRGLDLNEFGGEDLAAEWAVRTPSAGARQAATPSPDSPIAAPSSPTADESEQRPSLVRRTAAVPRAVLKSRTFNALSAFAALATGAVKSAWDWAVNSLDLLPNAVSQTQD